MSKLHHVEHVGTSLVIDYGRFPGKDTDDEYKFYKRAMHRSAVIDERRLSLQASGKLTPAGIKDKLAEVYAEGSKEADNDAREIERQMAEANERVDRMALSGVGKIEPGDAVSFLQDMELRKHWASLGGNEQSNLHVEMLQGRHPEMTHALLRGSPLVTGLLPSRRTLMQNALIPLEKREQMGYVQDHIKRLSSAKDAVQAGMEAARGAAGLLPSEARTARGLPSMSDEALARHGITSPQDAD